MTQEQKDLLLKDLSSRFPYGVNCKIYHKYRYFDMKLSGVFDNEAYFTDDNGSLYIDYENVKPYLFPLSSMTDELWDKEFMGCSITKITRDSFKYGCETLEFNNSNPYLSSMVRFINQLIKNHFDIHGLIPMGLAIDATDKNIY